MLFKDISIIDKDMQVKHRMYVGVVDDRISYISDKMPEEKDVSSYGQAYDGQNKLLMPAFYNAHTHSCMVLLRSRADNLPLQEWLEQNNFPFEAKMTEEDHYWSMLLGMAEMAMHGIVCCSDMYFYPEIRCKAVAESKMKANICEHVVDFEGKDFKDTQYYKTIQELLKNWHNAENGKIKIEACLHSEYLTTERICRGVSEYALDNDLILHIHMSETQQETLECKERHNGLTPPEYFNSIGALDPKTLIVHAVWLEDHDLDIIASKPSSLVTCAASNMKLGSGFADIPAWIKKGINFAIGTDGACSNNNYNFLQDMYLTSLISKGINHDPCAVTTKQIMYAATRGGAIAHDRNDCGSIQVGYKADLCVMDLSSPVWCPETNTLNNLLYAGQGSDIALTMCDGQVIYKDGQWPFIDIEKAKYEVNKSRIRIDKELSKDGM